MLEAASKRRVTQLAPRETAPQDNDAVLSGKIVTAAMSLKLPGLAADEVLVGGFWGEIRLCSVTDKICMKNPFPPTSGGKGRIPVPPIRLPEAGQTLS
jgi:hypothetical protein